MSSLDRMLDTALELDTGRYSRIRSPVILYVIRLLVRVEGFLLFLRDDERCGRTRGLRREDRCGLLVPTRRLHVAPDAPWEALR